MIERRAIRQRGVAPPRIALLLLLILSQWALACAAPPASPPSAAGQPRPAADGIRPLPGEGQCPTILDRLDPRQPVPVEIHFVRPLSLAQAVDFGAANGATPVWLVHEWDDFVYWYMAPAGVDANAAAAQLGAMHEETLANLLDTQIQALADELNWSRAEIRRSRQEIVASLRDQQAYHRQHGLDFVSMRVLAPAGQMARLAGHPDVALLDCRRGMIAAPEDLNPPPQDTELLLVKDPTSWTPAAGRTIVDLEEDSLRDHVYSEFFWTDTRGFRYPHDRYEHEIVFDQWDFVACADHVQVSWRPLSVLNFLGDFDFHLPFVECLPTAMYTNMGPLDPYVDTRLFDTEPAGETYAAGVTQRPDTGTLYIAGFRLREEAAGGASSRVTVRAGMGHRAGSYAGSADTPFAPWKEDIGCIFMPIVFPYMMKQAACIFKSFDIDLSTGDAVIDSGQALTIPWDNAHLAPAAEPARQ